MARRDLFHKPRLRLIGYRSLFPKSASRFLGFMQLCCVCYFVKVRFAPTSLSEEKITDKNPKIFVGEEQPREKAQIFRTGKSKRKARVATMYGTAPYISKVHNRPRGVRKNFWKFYIKMLDKLEFACYNNCLHSMRKYARARFYKSLKTAEQRRICGSV